MTKQIITNNRARIATAALCDLAERFLTSDNKPVSLETFAQAELASMSYLEQIFADLRCAGIVKSHRGPNGGYTLARDPYAISMLDVVMATTIHPLDRNNGYFWGRLELVLRMELAEHSLGTLVGNKKEQREAA